MSIGLLSGLMNNQSQAAIPAGQDMQVVMVSRQNIVPNPDNDIYTTGNLDSLKDDIQQNGLRQPLEVIPSTDAPDNYMLISGHRRWMACTILALAGDARFEMLPCLIRQSQGDLDNRIALITANATARDLTDGERVAQYEALKQALTEKKKAGQLEGKVRDELCRILGLSTGAAARLNVIASCGNDDIRERLKSGDIGLMEAYRYAQDYARYNGEKPEEDAQKSEPMKTLPKNPDYEEWGLPPEAIQKVEEAHRKTEKAPGTSMEEKPRRGMTDISKVSPYKAPEKKAEEKQDVADKPEKPRGYSTLYELAKKTLKDEAPWELEWEDVQFQLEYYSQSLPGGAKLWKRIDETRQAAQQVGFADYAIILQDHSFFTCGWVTCLGIVEDLTNYFELK